MGSWGGGRARQKAGMGSGRDSGPPTRLDYAEDGEPLGLDPEPHPNQCRIHQDWEHPHEWAHGAAGHRVGRLEAD